MCQILPRLAVLEVVSLYFASFHTDSTALGLDVAVGRYKTSIILLRILMFFCTHGFRQLSDLPAVLDHGRVGNTSINTLFCDCSS